ncbi:MAG: N-acetyl sugar amidotransferase [Gammaproteobacteria bacterium]|nr:N-acetyl sugar amidotransferase [Gammaproteobacteria bacterium]
MSIRSHQICERCIMDTSDPHIHFDNDGTCSHCKFFDESQAGSWQPNAEGKQAFEAIVSAIREENRFAAYDCIIGLSGGLDSAYLAYVARRQFGLRLLAVHVDGGWNSELAVRNIEGIVKTLDIELHTLVVDWEEMRDVQRAFLRAGLANQDVPQDHAFIAGLYGEAVKHGIRHVLSGGNFATESVLPTEWAYNAMDLRHLRAIHRRFGEHPLRNFPTVSFFQYYFWYPVVKRMTVLRPLNYLPYNRDDAIHVLERETGFQYYGGKHFESVFTKWQQLFYRPMKFGYDERRAYLSSLVLSGQMQRADALEEIRRPGYTDAELDAATEYVRNKLGFSAAEFADILAAPPGTFRDYPSNHHLFAMKDRLKHRLATMGIRLRRRS